jgi:hypothetical protein
LLSGCNLLISDVGFSISELFEFRMLDLLKNT